MRTAAREGVQIMLDGDGGDELFGPRTYLLADRLRAGHPRQAFELAHKLPGAGPHVRPRDVAAMFASLALVGSLPYRPHGLALSLIARREAPGWLLGRAVDELVDSDDPLAWKRLDGPRWWAQAAYGIAYGIEQAGVFEHQRRRAGLAGLEARHPLLDLDLVELSLRQSPLLTFDRRYSRPLLRESMAGLLPDSVRLRPGKAQFESLIVDCLTGPDGVAVRAILTSPRAELRAFLDQAQMRRTLLRATSCELNSHFGGCGRSGAFSPRSCGCAPRRPRWPSWARWRHRAQLTLRSAPERASYLFPP